MKTTEAIQYTAGAMRAARQMEEIFGFDVLCPPIEYGIMLEFAAKAIDDETGAAELLEALRGVVAIADRKTVEFDRARAAIAKATGNCS